MSGTESGVSSGLLERFTLLKRTLTEDGTGGAAESFTDGESFMGRLVRVTCRDAETGFPAGRAAGTLVFEGSAPAYHDPVRRESDGTVWRLCGPVRTPPACASVGLCEVQAERLITADTEQEAAE